MLDEPRDHAGQHPAHAVHRRLHGEALGMLRGAEGIIRESVYGMLGITLIGSYFQTNTQDFKAHMLIVSCDRPQVYLAAQAIMAQTWANTPTLATANDCCELCDTERRDLYQCNIALHVREYRPFGCDGWDSMSICEVCEAASADVEFRPYGAASSIL